MSKWTTHIDYTDQMIEWVQARPYTMAKSFRQKFSMTGHRAAHVLVHMERRGLISVVNRTKKRILYEPVKCYCHYPNGCEIIEGYGCEMCANVDICSQCKHELLGPGCANEPCPRHTAICGTA